MLIRAIYKAHLPFKWEGLKTLGRSRPLIGDSKKCIYLHTN